MVALSPNTVRLRPAAISTLGLCLLAASPCFARLQSSKAQEEAMVKAAVAVSEKWQGALGRTFRADDSTQAEVALVRKQVEARENGIFADMSIGADVATMVVSARRRGRGMGSFDGFDEAAARLAAADQVRYYCAKAGIHAEFFDAARTGDSLNVWLEREVADYSRAAANGFPPKDALTIVKQQAGQAGLVYYPMDACSCRIYQAYLPFAIANVHAAHAAHRQREVYGLALGIMRELPPSLSLKRGDCDLNDPVQLAAFYDSRLVRPLSRLLGRDEQEFVLETCDTYWDHRRLVALLLTRVRTPSNKAFGLFRRAGEDDILKADRSIALAELTLWKRAGKLAQFKRDYPARYRVAVPRSKK
jgi:hypothetical protein